MRLSSHVVCFCYLGFFVLIAPMGSAADSADSFGACVTKAIESDFAAADQMVSSCDFEEAACQALADQAKVAKQDALQKAQKACANPLHPGALTSSPLPQNTTFAQRVQQPARPVSPTPVRASVPKQAAQPQVPTADPPASSPASAPAATPTPAPAPTAGPVQPTNQDSQPASGQDTAAAQTQANSDIRSCTNAQASASRCCANPASCGTVTANSSGGASQNGMVSCQQMNSLGQGSASLNNQLASICAGSQSSCQYTCSQLISTYTSYVQNCSGCASASIYQNTLNTLQAQNDVCNQLTAQVTTLGGQATNGALASGGANGCQDLSNNLAAATPQSAAPTAAAPAANAGSSFNPGDPYGCAANPSSPACQNCASNPGSAACRSLAAQKNIGQAGYATNSQDPARNKDGFNVSDLADNMAPVNSLTPTAPTQAARTPTVPNNGGGSGFPGADKPRADSGGSAPRASGSGFTPPELSLHSGGGYSQNYQAEGGVRSFLSQFNPFRKKDGPMKVSLDLKQFLPGGVHDPHRGLAGLSSEINGQGEDLFKRISNKIVEKCKLGLLLECFP